MGDTTEGFGIEAQDAEGGLVIMDDTDRFANRFPDSGREYAPLGEFHALRAVESEQFEGDVGGLDGDGDGGRGVDGVVGEGDLVSLVIFEATGGGVRLTVDLEREERAAMASGTLFWRLPLRRQPSMLPLLKCSVKASHVRSNWASSARLGTATRLKAARMARL